MKRRNVLQSVGAFLVTLLVPFRVKGDTIPVTPVSMGDVPTIPVRMAEWTRRTMTWACVCLRRGAHWTIGAIDFVRANIGQVRHHLVSVHGHNYSELDGMSKEQLGNLHDAHHEGRSYGSFRFPATPRNGVDHLTVPRSQLITGHVAVPRSQLTTGGCPGGICPVNKAASRSHLNRLFGG